MTAATQNTAEPHRIVVLISTQIYFTKHGFESMGAMAGRVALAWSNLLIRWFTTSKKVSPFLVKDVPSAENEFKGGPGVYATHGALQSFMLFRVCDWRRGALAIQHELAGLELLPLAQIARLDISEGIWRACYPADKPAIDPPAILAKMLSQGKTDAPRV